MNKKAVKNFSQQMREKFSEEKEKLAL